MKTIHVLFASLAVVGAFQAPPAVTLRSTVPSSSAAMRLSRRSGPTSTSMSMIPDVNMPQVYAAATQLLLAFDPDGSKTDSLYNGVPATGAVE